MGEIEQSVSSVTDTVRNTSIQVPRLRSTARAGTRRAGGWGSGRMPGRPALQAALLSARGGEAHILALALALGRLLANL